MWVTRGDDLGEGGAGDRVVDAAVVVDFQRPGEDAGCEGGGREVLGVVNGRRGEGRYSRAGTTGLSEDVGVGGVGEEGSRAGCGCGGCQSEGEEESEVHGGSLLYLTKVRV